MLLRHYVEQGTCKSVLAPAGVSCDTIHRWIRDGDLDRDLETAVRYGPRAAVATRLDAYKLEWPGKSTGASGFVQLLSAADRGTAAPDAGRYAA
jgi:hypothetical protein